jgi:uncharacterized protein (DUF2235 family)
MTPLAATYDVVLRHVYLLDRQRHERQEGAMELFRKWQPLNKARGDLFVLQKVALSLRDEVEKAKDIGLRVKLEHLLEHALSAGIGV